jgi:hypothetical protein
MTAGSAAPVGRDALVERFASFPRRLAEVARLSEGRPVAPGEWTTTEVVRHLVAVESMVWQARLRDLATLEEPHWTRTEPGLGHGFKKASLDEALEAFTKARAATVEAVRALDDAGWARAGIHETYGRLDVAGLLRLAIDHDEEHLAGFPRTD